MATNNETKIDPIIETAKELLKLQRQQDRWKDEIQSSGHLEIREPISDDYLLLHLALDILGEPKEGELSGDPYEEPHCRDFITDLYCSMVGENDDIDGFTKIVIESNSE